ncbi:unnamed product [Ostreococcus tauri]|uniref:Unnamed product n=1 Tax=Ostreococcus tauri TaxID=70448 RepID=A0A090LZN2_OSTTA|nr:unnamed product [Ostreococcus tauri]CEF97465.1 unnamed product [Ostreococcus tauri]|eukprot:XP_022838708.1 unnamed product [Ostreococcus tauri]
MGGGVAWFGGVGDEPVFETMVRGEEVGRFMDAVGALAAADVAKAFAERRVVDDDAVVEDEGVETDGGERDASARDASAQTEDGGACEACERRESELGRARREIRALRVVNRGTAVGRRRGTVRCVRAQRETEAPAVRSTASADVQAPRRTSEATAPKDTVVHEKNFREDEKALRAKRRHALRTAVMAKRSRARRAAREAAESARAREREQPRQQTKAAWNDSVDVNAEPRKKTNEEYFDALHKLVVAQEKENTKERLKRLQKERRRRLAQEATAAKFRIAKHAPPRVKIPLTPRSSVDSTSSFISFESAVTDACHGVDALELNS